MTSDPEAFIALDMASNSHFLNRLTTAIEEVLESGESPDTAAAKILAEFADDESEQALCLVVKWLFARQNEQQTRGPLEVELHMDLRQRLAHETSAAGVETPEDLSDETLDRVIHEVGEAASVSVDVDWKILEGGVPRSS